MSGYFGTPMQQRLQAQAEANVDFINATPGACQNGRMMGSDDPDRLGWNMIETFLDRDGVFGFRLLPAAKAEELRSRLVGMNLRLDTWDVYLADQVNGLAASEAIISQRLPDGLVELSNLTETDDQYIIRIQTLMAEAGVVPFSGSLLLGELGPAKTVSIGDRSGNIVAAAHAYMPHNAYGAYHRYAWGGLVAVAETHRGQRLGNYINARMIEHAFTKLGATHIYELVSSSNAPSRRMVESCGLRFDPNFVCGMATPNESGRFTK